MRFVGTLVSVVVVLVAAWIVWSHWAGEPARPLDPFRLEAARIVAGQVATTINIDNELEGTVMMGPITGDNLRLEVSQIMRDAIANSGRYHLTDVGQLKAALRERGKKLADYHQDATLAAEIREAMGAEGVLAGKLVRFPDPRGTQRTEMVLVLDLHDREGKQVFEQRFEAKIEPSIFSLAWCRAALAATGGWTRFFCWLAIVLLPPLLLVSVIKRVLARDDNISNLLLLLGLTAWGSLGCLIAIGLRLDGFWDGIGLLVGSAAVALYNYIAIAAVEYYLR